MPAITETLLKVLKDLERIGDIEASAVVSTDGLLMVASVPEGTHTEIFAAMSATMLGSGRDCNVGVDEGGPR
ncbi:MAG: roadblock/LC7 domain-containing protein [Euryarchaeota archaeon]|nr:roadblock/LC7 domain-containing protein [Euryarchaeota archaeon]